MSNLPLNIEKSFSICILFFPYILCTKTYVVRIRIKYIHVRMQYIYYVVCTYAYAYICTCTFNISKRNFFEDEYVNNVKDEKCGLLMLCLPQKCIIPATFTMVRITQNRTCMDARKLYSSKSVVKKMQPKASSIFRWSSLSRIWKKVALINLWFHVQPGAGLFAKARFCTEEIDDTFILSALILIAEVWENIHVP